jgi:hypothetical protein
MKMMMIPRVIHKNQDKVKEEIKWKKMKMMKINKIIKVKEIIIH